MSYHKSINTKIMRKYLYYILYIFGEDIYHAPLKCGRCIAKTKRHAFICKGTKWTSKGCFILVLLGNYYLIGIGVPI